jgi:hypothetical protein
MTEVLTNPQPQAPKEVAFAVLRVPFFLEPHADESVPFVGTNRQRLLEKWGGPAGTFIVVVALPAAVFCMPVALVCGSFLLTLAASNMYLAIAMHRLGGPETTARFKGSRFGGRHSLL